MSQQLDLRDLAYFEAIADTGHVGRAAERMFRTPPALTLSVRRLERVLGTSLFEPVGRGIRLTPAGEALRARARRLRIAADETVQEVGDVARGFVGHVRLGISPSMAQPLLQSVCRMLMAEAHGVTLKTVIGQGDVLNAALRAGELDIIVATHSHSDDFESHPILSDTVVVAASASHEVFRKKRLGLADLVPYRWLLPPPSVQSRQWLDQVFMQHGLPGPTVQVETNLMLALPQLIEETGLISFISRPQLGPGRGLDLKEVPLKATTLKRRFHAIHRKDSYLSPVAQRLLTLLRTRGDGLLEY